MNKSQYCYLPAALCMLFLTGCKISTPLFFSSDPAPVRTTVMDQDQPVIQSYAAQLVSQLLAKPLNFPPNARVAVGTFLPSLASPTSQQLQLGAQLQDSLATVMTQAGFKLTELTLRQRIKISPEADLFLSRDPSQLHQDANAQYLVVGTLNSEQTKTQVNLRLVNTSDQSVVAAATTYIPNNVAWGHEKVSLRAGQLNRSAY